LVWNMPCYVHVVFFPSFIANHNQTNHVDWSDFYTLFILNNNPVSLNTASIDLNATQVSLNKLWSR